MSHRLLKTVISHYNMVLEDYFLLRIYFQFYHVLHLIMFYVLSKNFKILSKAKIRYFFFFMIGRRSRPLRIPSRPLEWPTFKCPYASRLPVASPDRGLEHLVLRPIAISFRIAVVDSFGGRRAPVFAVSKTSPANRSGLISQKPDFANLRLAVAKLSLFPGRSFDEIRASENSYESFSYEKKKYIKNIFKICNEISSL